MPFPKLFEICHAGTKILIDTQLGGRLAYMGPQAGPNLLKCELEALSQPAPALSSQSDFKGYNGLEIWTSPQCEWWIHQSENAERRDQAAMWPPDPYLAYQACECVEEETSPTKLTVTLGASPFSGLALKKSYEILNDGSLLFTLSMTNTSSQARSFGHWYNMRMDGFAVGCVPISGAESCRVVPVPGHGEMPYATDGGYFRYLPIAPPAGKAECSSKTFIKPRLPYLAGFAKDYALFMQYDAAAAEAVHPEQAPAEVYCHTEAERANALLELEAHTSYLELAPGATSTSAVKLKFVMCPGAGDTFAFQQAILSDYEKQLPSGSLI